MAFGLCNLASFQKTKPVSPCTRKMVSELLAIGKRLGKWEKFGVITFLLKEEVEELGYEKYIVF